MKIGNSLFKILLTDALIKGDWFPSCVPGISLEGIKQVGY